MNLSKWRSLAKSLLDGVFATLGRAEREAAEQPCVPVAESWGETKPKLSLINLSSGNLPAVGT